MKLSSVSELIVQSPDGLSRHVTLSGDRIALGRSSTNELCYPDDAGLSRQHLAFERAGSDWTIRDLGSKNGTQVNSNRITAPHVLKPGDRVTAGHLIILYRSADEPAPVHTVYFVTESSSPSATTVATDLEGVLGPRPESPAAALSSANSVQALIRAGQELSGHRPLNELFPVILDLAIEAVGATRAVLMALEGSELVVRAARGNDFQISTAIRDRVLNQKQSVLVHDAQLDADLAGRQSIVMQGMRSIMAVPLQTRDQVLGLVYVDTQDLLRPFGEEDLKLLTVMANVAAIRIEQARLSEVEQTEKLMSRELAQAAEIQRGLLPASDPNIDGLEVAGHNIPCHTVGGDYYDYFPYPDGRLGIVVADVAGKGMPAAMMMSNFQAHMQMLTESGGAPAQVMARINRSVAVRCPGNRFITCFLAVIDPATGEMVYCNAGHNPPLLVRSDGMVESLEGGGMILGIYAGAEYEERRTHMQVGDLLALYSDGVTEACQPQREEEFGELRLGELLHANRSRNARTVLDAVLKSLYEWSAGTAFADDVTLIVARRN